MIGGHDVTIHPFEGADGWRVAVTSWTGVSVKFDPADPSPVRGGHLDSVMIRRDLSGMPEDVRHRVLRLARALVRPGGRVALPAPAATAPGIAAWVAEREAWVCGLETQLETEPAEAPGASRIVLRRPLHDDPATPLVSILIPAYKADHLRDALVCALEQDHPRTEILLCDDDPGDGVGRVVDDLGAARDRIRYVRNDGNIGGRRNYLQCFDLARGDYVKFLNDDDVLAPDCVSTMAHALNARPDVTLVTSYRSLIDADGAPLPDDVCNLPLAGDDVLVPGPSLARLALGSRINRIGEPTTVMFRRRDLAANRPHMMSYADRSALRNGDMSMWSALLSRGDAVIVARPLSSLRIHAAQVQRSDAFRSEALRAWDILVDDARRTGLIAPSARSGRAAWATVPSAADAMSVVDEAVALMERGDRSGALGRLDLVLRLDPALIDVRREYAVARWESGRRAEGLIALGFVPRRDGLDDAARDVLAAMLDAAGLASAARRLGATPITT